MIFSPAAILSVLVVFALVGAAAWFILRRARQWENRPVAKLTPADSGLDFVRQSAEALGLVVATEDVQTLSARSGGSPYAAAIALIALIAVVVFAVAGLLTRNAGTLYLISGVPVADDAASYRGRDDGGPIFGDRYTGATLTLQPDQDDRVVEGKQASPVVVISSSGGRAASVRLGGRALAWPLTAQVVQSGPAVVIALKDGKGRAMPDRYVVLKKQADDPFGAFFLRDGTTSRTVSARLIPGPRIELSASGDMGRTMSQGEDMGLASGLRLRVKRFASFAVVKVTNDWSWPFTLLSALIALGAAGYALARPFRALRARIDSDQAVVEIFAARWDVGFVARAKETVGSA